MKDILPQSPLGLKSGALSPHLVGSTGRVVVREEGGVNLIHCSEVVDVGQQHGGLHHVVEGAVGRLQDVAWRWELNEELRGFTDPYW